MMNAMVMFDIMKDRITYWKLRTAWSLLWAKYRVVDAFDKFMAGMSPVAIGQLILTEQMGYGPETSCSNDDGSKCKFDREGNTRAAGGDNCCY
jgi:hypothetical protein